LSEILTYVILPYITSPIDFGGDFLTGARYSHAHRILFSPLLERAFGPLLVGKSKEQTRLSLLLPKVLFKAS